MTVRADRQGLLVDPQLVAFIENEALPGTGITPAQFWPGFATLLADLTPKNRALLTRREQLQAAIDGWHLARRDQPHDAVAYRNFLTTIGYLQPDGPDFSIETTSPDPEIALIPGPQLVVPVMNARYALNAANARWGSLYDALYGTDALGELPPAGGYDAERGARVIAWGRRFLDQAVPLLEASWSQARGIRIKDGALRVTLEAGETGLVTPAKLVGYVGAVAAPTQVLLKNHGLHIAVPLDANHPIGKTDLAQICDLRIESAISAIIDCEDSIAAVDAADKVVAYTNWLGLMKGDLAEPVTKNGRTSLRALAPDLEFTTPDGEPALLKGRALMLIRNVGHLMTNPAIVDRDGREVPEGLLDAMVTVLCAVHDLRKTAGRRNSITGAVYVVKPKMHGPDEVAFADEIFSRVEAVLGLPEYSVKLGIMDEERRTSVNLKACIRAARHRVAFINTGFLDRTGDELHTSMEAGPMVRKGDMKAAAWITAYENRNVDIGLACGLQRRAQIGKGMWAMPDRMADMLAAKLAHPAAGANCAWVPSPTAATLHATHYHAVDVFARQAALQAAGPRNTLDDLLVLPLADPDTLRPRELQAEIENNAQGILGYVVRWVDLGIGCSKVPDIHDVALMEDRATCRISSQALANWLHHGVVSPDAVLAALRKMAAVVDRQNAAEPDYRPMSPDYDGLAFQAACDLVFTGRQQPSGYTEPVLHARRLQVKARRGTCPPGEGSSDGK